MVVLCQSRPKDNCSQILYEETSFVICILEPLQWIGRHQRVNLCSSCNSYTHTHQFDTVEQGAVIEKLKHQVWLNKITHFILSLISHHSSAAESMHPPPHGVSLHCAFLVCPAERWENVSKVSHPAGLLWVKSVFAFKLFSIARSGLLIH